MGGSRGFPDTIRALQKTLTLCLRLGESAAVPERSRHLGLGQSAAVRGILQWLDIAGIIEDVLGSRRQGAGASTGPVLALAALNRIMAPTSKLGFADRWKATDMTNILGSSASANENAPNSRRGNAQQKRNDLRLVGLGLVITAMAGSRCSPLLIPRSPNMAV